jgi:hypothetical protein
MKLSDGSWTQTVGVPNYPTLIAPHALQDDFGSFRRGNEIMMIPGVFSAYDPGSPNCNYCGGIFFYNPSTKTYRQDTTLFQNVPTPNPNPPPATFIPGKTSNWTGCVFGGAYDDVNDNVVVLADSQYGAFAVMSWNIATMTKNPNIPFTVPPGPNGLKAAYFTRSRHVKLGRKVYVIGYWTDGTIASQTPLLFSWDLDLKVAASLAPPPVDGTTIRDINTRPAAGATKLVWPNTPNGPDGVIKGIYVYDPATNTWAVDNQVPASGYFAGNAVVELPNNRIGFVGSVFGAQQTNFWMYQPA